MAAARNEFVEYIVELMAGWAMVSARKMFGGYGLYREGSIFALIASDQLYFKADERNQAQFESIGSSPFVYVSQTRTVQMSYWSAPDASLESAAEMSIWCQSAYAAALRTQANKPKKGKRK